MKRANIGQLGPSDFEAMRKTTLTTKDKLTDPAAKELADQLVAVLELLESVSDEFLLAKTRDRQRMG